MTSISDLYIPLHEPEIFFIRRIWRIREFHSIKKTETILPKGTVEIIFNMAEDITYFNPHNNVREKLSACFINGVNFNPFQLEKSGQQVFLGIQLYTIGLKALFGISARELNDTVVEGSQIARSLNGLSHALAGKKTFREQVETILKWTGSNGNIQKQERIVSKFFHLFYTQKLTDLTVQNFCRDHFISERQLRRLSSEWLGMCPEKYLRYNKYLASLQLLHFSDQPLTKIGLEAGYYDQSHFIREFKSFTGLTPGVYKLAVKGQPGHIFI